MKVWMKPARLWASLLFFAFLLLLFARVPSVLAAGNCITPESGMRISADAVFCSGTHHVSNILVAGENSTVHCGGATLEGSLSSSGIIITAAGVKLKSCTLLTYKKAIVLDAAPGAAFEKVTLRNNVIGIHAVNTPLKPRGVLFEGNERNMLIEQKEQNEYPVSTAVPESLLSLFGIEPAAHRAAMDGVLLEKKVVTSQTESTFFITLTATRDFENLVLYEHIPKSLAASAGEVVFSYPDVEIVNPDPDFLIPIGRIKVNTKLNIEYSIAKKTEPADEMPVSVLAELPLPMPGESEKQGWPDGEAALSEPFPSESDTPLPESSSATSLAGSLRGWPLFFLLLAAVVFIVFFRIEKMRLEQH